MASTRKGGGHDVGGFVPMKTRVKANRDEYREDLLERVNEISVGLKKILPLDEVTRRAVLNYNDFWRFSNPDKYIRIETASEPVLHRIAVNYLRHDLSKYHQGLDVVRNTVAGAAAALVLKQRVLLEIMDAYPELISEAHLQLCRVGEDYA